MIIVITGSVGVGKSTLAEKIAKELKYDVIHLTEYAQTFVVGEDAEDQTKDIDTEELFVQLEDEIDDNVVVEGHFAHEMDPNIVDKLIVINRDLKDLNKVYEKREYDKNKKAENLEVESFDTCYHEALEKGYPESKILKVDNKDLEETQAQVLRFLKEK